MTRLKVLLAALALVSSACGGGGGGNDGNNSGAPTVLSTDPADASTGRPRNVSVSATFSEAMDPLTLDATSFVLMEGTTTIPGTVSYAGTTATLVPTAVLLPDTLYTATIGDTATDTEGTPLAADATWTFRTVASSASGPAVVDLATAGSFAILAKSAVSTTGTTAVVGDLGLSPSAASFITGFTCASPPTTFTTCDEVTGEVFASDYDAPTPADLTAAVLDMEAAYTDAAGRTLPDFTELGAGNVDGMTLVPGLYKWGTGVMIPIGVTLSGSSTDVWIFQVAGDLTVGNGAIVTLSGGAQAQNVFWQVAGQATLGTTSDFKGIILSQTLIEMNTGTTLLGRAFAQTAVTLDATDVTQP